MSKDKPATGDKEKKIEPKAPASVPVKKPTADNDPVVVEHNLEGRFKNKAEDAKEAEPSKNPGQVKIFVKDEAPTATITAEKHCAGMRPDQSAGFLAECRLRHKPNELATVKEWAKRYQAFIQRPIK